MPTSPVILKAHCNSCSRTTSHTEVALRKTSDDSEDERGIEEWGTTYRMMQCRGCDSVLLRADNWHSHFDAGPPEYYPPRVARRSPTWMWQLPPEWWSLMREVYTALHADSRRLALMGARTLIDIYMNYTVGDLGGFDKKLQAMVDDGHLSIKDKDVLSAALEAGHAAAHRAHSPSMSNVSHVMDIVEHLLHRHALATSADELKKATPKRQPNSK